MVIPSAVAILLRKPDYREAIRSRLLDGLMPTSILELPNSSCASALFQKAATLPAGHVVPAKLTLPHSRPDAVLNKSTMLLRH